MFDTVRELLEGESDRPGYLPALDELLAAEERLKKLDALEASGVDNWEGYDFSMEELLQSNQADGAPSVALCELLRLTEGEAGS